MIVIRRALGDGKRPFPAAAAALLVASALSLPAGESAKLFSKGPYVQAPQPGTVTIFWESATNHPGTVRYGWGRNLKLKLTDVLPQRMKGRSSSSATNEIINDLGTSEDRPRPEEPTAPERGRTNAPARGRLRTVYWTNTYYLYEAVLEGLKPGVAYSYMVEMNGVATAPQQFRALEPGASKVRFLAYGDTRSDSRIHASLARRFAAEDPAFIMHTGDLVAKGKDYALWSKEFFNPMAGVIGRIPFFSVIGNHEEDGTNYLAYFHLPGKELWYSFDAGPVHVLALDYHFEKSSSEQFRYASNDLLNARAPWKVVVVHYPVFNVGGHATGWGHTNYLPLFHQAKVDLVLAGHSHLYERFRPLAPRGDTNEWPVTCITTGGGGANLHPSYDHPALFSRETTNHFMVFDVTRDTLKARTIRENGTLIDRFELVKKKGQPLARYRAEVYPEEALKIYFDIAPNLAGRAAALPTNDLPARVLLTLQPRKKSPLPAVMEITLAPESALDYELVNSPVRVSTPSKGSTNQFVWLEVKATGRKPIKEDKGRNFVPPLVFQAHVKAEEGETVTYGIPARFSGTAERMARKLWPPPAKSAPARPSS
jgi:hypothetical protein